MLLSSTSNIFCAQARHPGEVLKHDFMEPFALSSNALAKAIAVTPPRINEIVRGRRGITAETALRLARYFRTDAQSWMNLQDRTNSRWRRGVWRRRWRRFGRGMGCDGERRRCCTRGERGRYFTCNSSGRPLLHEPFGRSKTLR